ncbi:hypothetical protein C8R43DRAFT_1125208 [Mycena crocata]|nr:hypothetical protein C8R43DRAFT_1125208 [Mycena crocata]
MSSVASSISDKAHGMKKVVKKVVQKGVDKFFKRNSKPSNASNDSIPSLASCTASSANSEAGSVGNVFEDETDEQELARLRARWRSPVYSFYKSTVTIGYDKGRKYHFFYCTNPKCRNGKNGGIRRYLDKKDLASTGNCKGNLKARVYSRVLTRGIRR